MSDTVDIQTIATGLTHWATDPELAELDVADLWRDFVAGASGVSATLMWQSIPQEHASNFFRLKGWIAGQVTGNCDNCSTAREIRS